MGISVRCRFVNGDIFSGKEPLDKSKLKIVNESDTVGIAFDKDNGNMPYVAYMTDYCGRLVYSKHFHTFEESISEAKSVYGIMVDYLKQSDNIIRVEDSDSSQTMPNGRVCAYIRFHEKGDTLSTHALIRKFKEKKRKEKYIKKAYESLCKDCSIVYSGKNVQPLTLVQEEKP